MTNSREKIDSKESYLFDFSDLLSLSLAYQPKYADLPVRYLSASLSWKFRNEPDQSAYNGKTVGMGKLVFCDHFGTGSIANIRVTDQ